jgi:hypothetical protein
MNSKIVFVQEPKPRHGQGRVDVYQFDLTAKVPAIVPHTSFFLYELLGHNSREFLISPKGGLVHDTFGKPIAELRDPSMKTGCYSGLNGDPNQLAYTREDTDKFWILHNNEFISQLTKEGWLHFPAAEEIDGYEQERMGLKRESPSHWRSFSLDDLIKAIQTTDNEGRDYGKATADLEELRPFGSSLHFVYRDGFLHMPEI